MTRKSLLLTLGLLGGLLCSLPSNAQTSSTTPKESRLSGVIVDSSDRSPAIGALVECALLSDTTQRLQTAANLKGAFALSPEKSGNYRLRISFLGLQPYETTVTLGRRPVVLDTIYLQPDAQALKEVSIEVAALRTTQKGDTLIYNAGSYKVTQDATTETLLSKMPGLKVENGTVEAQGETVKKVLVDGKEFFGEDVTMAIKNLPAEVVDKVEVFDKQSDQAAFAGVDDGEGYKAINIVTQRGIDQAQFGKFYAGYGFNDLYNVGANINFFRGNRRITLLGMANNINQQNFGIDDLMGVMGNAGGRGGRGGGSMGNFMVGNQSGVSTVKSFGINYVNQWREKVKFEGSYFFNTAKNFTESLTERTYFANQLYNEAGRDNSRNFNHRVNGRVEYKINDNHQLTFNTSLQFQNNTRASLDTSATWATADPENELLNMFKQLSGHDAFGYNLSGGLNYMYKVGGKDGRVLSFSLNGGASKNDQDQTQYSLTRYINPDSSSLLDQYIRNHSRSYNVGGSVSYSEPLSQYAQMVINYDLSYRYSDRDKRSFDAPTDLFLDSLSNTYNSGYLTHQVGPGFRYNKDIVRFSSRVNYQYATLQGDQQYPSVAQARTTQAFQNVVYHAMLLMRFNQTNSLRMRLNSNTNNPSITQLQNVLDVSNPLYISQGNPNLKPVYSHNLRFNYMHTNLTKGRTFMAMFGGNVSQHYIANSVERATTDGYEVKDDAGHTIVVLDRGAQYSRPVNLNGYWNVDGVLSYGTPVKWLGSNVNFNFRTSYNATPTIYNLVQSTTRTLSYTGGIVIGSNISEKLDFTFSYNAGYNIARSSKNNEYFNGVGTGRIKWVTWKGITLSADGSYSKYRGVTDQFTEEYFLLNASIGKKIFRNQRGEINVTVNDILNQNKSFVRNVSENYIQNVTSNVLGRYVCINFVFNLRKFKGKDGKSYDQPQRSGHGEGRPAGAPPMGGPGGGGPDGPRGGGMPMMPMGGGGGPVGGF